MEVSVKYNDNHKSSTSDLGKPQTGKCIVISNDIPIQSQCFSMIDIGDDNINMARAIVGRLLKTPLTLLRVLL